MSYTTTLSEKAPEEGVQPVSSTLSDYDADLSSSGYPESPDLEDREKYAGILADTKKTDKAAPGLGFIVWTAINVASTVAIVFTNKYILSDISFHNCQVAFAAYHFFITGATLWVVSRPQCAIFIPKQVSIMQISPLAAAMCIQVVLQNLSLAYSSVMFHQLARLLLTPVVALLNYMLYSTKIPRAAVSPLILLCSGVGIVSYYDSLAMDSASAASTSSRGTIFALAGVCTSAVYTVWIGQYHKKFQLNSMQLLLNQAPVSTVLLLLTVHFTATPPLAAVPVSMWVLFLMVWRCIHVLSSALLTSTERPLCFFGESLAVFHHPLGGTHQRDGGRPAQDVHHCRAGMGFQHASHLFSEHCRDYAGVGGHELIYAGHDASAEVIH